MIPQPKIQSSDQFQFSNVKPQPFKMRTNILALPSMQYVFHITMLHVFCFLMIACKLDMIGCSVKLKIYPLDN